MEKTTGTFEKEVNVEVRQSARKRRSSAMEVEERKRLVDEAMAEYDAVMSIPTQKAASVVPVLDRTQSLLDQYRRELDKQIADETWVTSHSNGQNAALVQCRDEIDQVLRSQPQPQPVPVAPLRVNERTVLAPPPPLQPVKRKRGRPRKEHSLALLSSRPQERMVPIAPAPGVLGVPRLTSRQPMLLVPPSGGQVVLNPERAGFGQATLQHLYREWPRRQRLMALERSCQRLGQKLAAAEEEEEEEEGPLGRPLLVLRDQDHPPPDPIPSFWQPVGPAQSRATIDALRLENLELRLALAGYQYRQLQRRYRECRPDGADLDLLDQQPDTDELRDTLLELNDPEARDRAQRAAIEADKMARLEKRMKEMFTPRQMQLLLNEKHKVIWTVEDIRRALAVKKLMSRKAYNYLRNELKMPLPSHVSIHTLSRKYDELRPIYEKMVAINKQKFMTKKLRDQVNPGLEGRPLEDQELVTFPRSILPDGEKESQAQWAGAEVISVMFDKGSDVSSGEELEEEPAPPPPRKRPKLLITPGRPQTSWPGVRQASIAQPGVIGRRAGTGRPVKHGNWPV